MKGYKSRPSCLIDSNIFLHAFVRDDEKTWKSCVDVLKTAILTSSASAGLNRRI